MRTQSIIAALAAFASLSLVACIGEPPPGVSKPNTPAPDPTDDEPTDPTPPSPPSQPGPATIDAFFAQYDTSWCSDAFACVAQYPGVNGQTFQSMFGTSVGECAINTAKLVDEVNIIRDVTEGYITYNRNAANDCLIGLAAAATTCGDFWQNVAIPTACNDVWHPTVGNGDPCRSEIDCINSDATCTTGICIGPDGDGADGQN